jgi:ubiquinone/menaquinone biosynthesis C-methylase UbiE
VTTPIRSTSGLKNFYDDPEIVATYVARRTAQPLNSVLHERQVAFVNRAIAELAPERVLELAPGPGRLTAEITPARVSIGMDWSPRMLVEARKRTESMGVRRWGFVRGDGFRLPFGDDRFDLVFSVRFVRRFDAAGRQKLYDEIRRVLRPGGHLILDAQNRLVAGPHRANRDGYQVYDELWLREELIDELTKAGLEPRRLEGMMRKFSWQWRINRLRRFGLAGPARFLIRALEMGSDANPSTWMVLCQAR